MNLVVAQNSITPPSTLGSPQVTTTCSPPGTSSKEPASDSSFYGHTQDTEGCIFTWRVKNWASAQNHQVPKSASVWNNRAAEATCFSWHFLGNCKESEAGSWGKEKIQRLMFKSFPALMGEKADGTAKLWSFLTCTLYSSFVPKGRKKILGSSSSFLETSKVMPMVEYKDYILKIWILYNEMVLFYGLTKWCHPSPPPHLPSHNDFSYSSPSSNLPELLTVF